MTEKTLSHTFASGFCRAPQHSLFFVGYADPESPAGRIRAAAPGDKIELDADTGPNPIRCTVEQFSFSGHAPREKIMDYVLRLKPKKVLLVHGDPAAVAWFQETPEGGAAGVRDYLSYSGGQAGDLGEMMNADFRMMDAEILARFAGNEKG